MEIETTPVEVPLLFRGIRMMNENVIPAEILQLPVSQRVILVEQIWDSVVEDEAQFELTAAQKAELDRRLANHSKDPTRGSSWREVKERILGD